MAFVQTAHSLDPAKPGANLMSIEPENWRRFPPPVADMTLANANAAKPRASAAADWLGGAEGNDVDVAEATVTIAGSASAATAADYAPRTQAARAAQLGVAMAEDVGKDYGAFSGDMGRTGTIEPFQPYPTAPPPEPEP